ncbi:MAG: RHS repeat protein [Pirellulaceae bacterium]|nr:RHS repeat protein [Pirellulaceae bacterium]
MPLTVEEIRGQVIFCAYEVLETRSVDAEGFTTRSLTDGAGRTLQTIDQLGKISTMTYDAAGNVLSARDPNGVGYDVVYDELGRTVTLRMRCAVSSSAIPPARTVDCYVSRYTRLSRFPFPCFLVWICLWQIQTKKQVRWRHRLF